jgi:hypothetical protein
MSLAGDGTGVSAPGEPQGRADLPAGGLGTGVGAQVTAAAGRRVGTGTGVAGPAPLGRVLATGLGRPATAGAVGTAVGEAPPGAVAVTEGAAPAGAAVG